MVPPTTGLTTQLPTTLPTLSHFTASGPMPTMANPISAPIIEWVVDKGQPFHDATISQNAAAIIFAHNHPSGVAEPSHADEQITKRLKDALALIDVRVLDHIVVGDECVSFAERGLL